MSEARETCPGCLGAGDWFTYCCNGAGGCSCRGGEVQMGACNVCGGTGRVDGTHNPRANVDAIRGLHFIGTGPNDMRSIWPNRAGIGAPIYRVPASMMDEEDAREEAARNGQFGVGA